MPRPSSPSKKVLGLPPWLPIDPVLEESEVATTQLPSRTRNERQAAPSPGSQASSWSVPVDKPSASPPASAEEKTLPNVLDIEDDVPPEILAQSPFSRSSKEDKGEDKEEEDVQVVTPGAKRRRKRAQLALEQKEDSGKVGEEEGEESEKEYSPPPAKIEDQ